MNLKELREIIDLVTEKGILEFELERSGTRIKISRRGVAAPAGQMHDNMVESSHLQAPAAAPPVSAPQTAPSPALAETGRGTAARVPEDLFVVRSPMVGTFYAAPGQDAPPYVSVGEHVRKGQVLCIIEAMKLMNEIEAEVDGEVVHCHAENAQPVEFGQPLFDIRTGSGASKRK